MPRTMRTLAPAAALAVAAVLAAPVSSATQASVASTTADPAFDFTKPNVVASNLTVPWGLAYLPDGSALVSERTTSRILQLRPGSQPTEVARLSGVQPTGEGGLLGLAVSPNYKEDGYVYAYYTAASDNRIVRFKLAASPQQEVIFSGIPKNSYHDGGRIHFGPDGMLYAGTGDAGRTANSQDWNSPGGKILRMTPTGAPAPGNPRANSVVYSIGHRNVQGLAWGGGHMYNAELGNNAWDEINHIEAGDNYGWPTVEGTGGEPTYHDPIAVWRTRDASPSGAAVAGDTLYAAALGGRRLWTVPLDGKGGASGQPTAVLQGTYGRLRTVEVGPDGWLWVTTSNRDGRGSPNQADDRVIRFPRKAR
ncbi:PQQ-dependent sugar dehydrogenase [Actinomadura spongiicola]|uniref:PQQ-dependent sugar dehydrogenase n=1 Tax=Actinomadura spongiicola TaxID=2303421 RepID=A0A372GG44_9ACTN|nr:PQQ-dependent sugar dehydrogenase [Actinomadura spongiicola]RFS84341.1 PQQ-dependent sugar dehydrogenase [Actinomadura spongiicola]